MVSAASRVVNRRAEAQRRLAAARRDPRARLNAANNWFRSELAVYTAAGGDASKLTDQITKAMLDAAEQLAKANRGDY